MVMRIILSPAKKMKEDLDGPAPLGLPRYLERTQQLLAYLRGLDLPALRKLLACNEQIAQHNYERFQHMDLRRGLTPALLAYEGIQYRYMAPAVFTSRELAYVQEHLFLLSGFYGILRPFDGVVPYRLEMQAKLRTDFCRDLYGFWGGSLAAALEGTDILLNLASEEYAKAVLPHLPPEVQVVTPVFGQLLPDRRVVEKGVYVKMARGEMVRFLAEAAAESPEALSAFDRLDFRYCPERSSPGHPVFLKAPEHTA